MSIRNVQCNHPINLKCSIQVTSQKYGCEQHDDGAVVFFFALFDTTHDNFACILKVSSKDSISLNVESVQTLMKGVLTMFNSCSFYVPTIRHLYVCLLKTEYTN